MTVACSKSDDMVTYDFTTEIEPILIDYCYDCHGDGMDKGDVALDIYKSPEELRKNLALWEGVHHNLERSLMPPSDKRQPSEEETEKLVSWIEASVFELDPHNPDPGSITIRRLNRDEYNNTVRDLIGQDLRPADEFPADDTGYGFDNVGDVLTLSPSLLERYVKSSRQTLDTVIVTRAPEPGVTVFSGEKGYKKRKGDPHLQSGTMSSSATIGVQFRPAKTGEYQIQVSAKGSPSKNTWPLMRIKVENGPQKDVHVESDSEIQTKKLNTKLQKDREIWIDISFLNDHYDPKAKDPRQRDRNLYLKQIRITGPLNLPIPKPTPSHRKLLALDDSEIQALSENARARHVIERFASRAWRRPLRDNELDRLIHIYEIGRTDPIGEKVYESGIKLAFQAIMVSPNFLFRGEILPQPDNASQVSLIDEFALASRLSFFLWSSMPDEELFELARHKKLRQQLDSQITRMLLDEKAFALTENFAGQWLQLRNLDLASPDPKQFTSWSPELRNAMREETQQFFSEIMRENRSIVDFLDADFTWVNSTLAKHYGIPNIKGEKFQRVSLTGDLRTQRGGVLSQASILTITSNPTRTSAVNRGNWVLENLLGSPPPPPPEELDIPALEEAVGKENPKNITLRQQLEMHREAKICSSCHARMDPIGFGLENFDAIGKWRTTENGQPIDTSGKLYTGELFNGPAELRHLFVESKRDAFVLCLSEKMLTWALGRGLEYYDKPTLKNIATTTAEKDYRFHELIKAIVKSPPFQKRRGDATTPHSGE